MLRRLYDWTISLAESPRATVALGAVSFAESSFFPVPPDVMLVPMSLAKPKKALFYAMLCTITSVAGGILGYAIGALLYDTLGKWIVELYGMTDKLEHFRDMYRQYGAWIILIKGLTPIPYKLVTIASGLAGYDFLMFVVLSLITRGARFYLLAGILNYFGEPIRKFIEANLTLMATLVIAAVLGGFYVVKFLF
ncbi:MAG TPA: YqaA family protein [Beijerinckiaceae bacterium]|nr:YqaA family protein [Beijerinckiaceae bacterium]